MIKFCSKYVFQYKIEYGIYFLLGIILCGLNTFIPAAMGCKLRSNGMPVPLLRNGYSIFNGTKYR